MGNKESYGVDTVSLLAYFVNALDNNANHIFQKAENLEIELIIPEIVIGECLYTIRKGRQIFGQKIPHEFQETIIQTLFQSPMYQITSINTTGWRWFLKSQIPELHDRMIVATCLQEKVQALITPDENIRDSDEIDTIW